MEKRSDWNDRRLWIESLQIVRVARHYGVLMFSDENYNGSVDDVGRTRGAAEFPAGREKCSSSDTISTSAARRNRASATCVAPSRQACPTATAGYPEISALRQSPIE